MASVVALAVPLEGASRAFASRRQRVSRIPTEVESRACLRDKLPARRANPSMAFPGPRATPGRRTRWPLLGPAGFFVSAQLIGVVAQVVFHEAGDEVVAVVVTRVAAQGERLATGFAGLPQQVGMQLPRQELVGHALVDEQGRFVRFGLCKGGTRRPLWMSAVASCPAHAERSSPR